MRRPTRPTGTLTAIVLALAGSLPALFSTTPVYGAQTTQPQVTQADPPASDQPTLDIAAKRRQLHSLFATLTVTLLLLVAFIVGASVMVRVRRAIVHRPRGHKPTDYVDAWAQYRLSQEDIERATGDVETGDPRSDTGPEDDDEESDLDTDEQR